MKNSIYFTNKVQFRQGETLVFFIGEDLSFETENKITSSDDLKKINSFLKNFKDSKSKDKIFSFDLSEKNKVVFILIKKNFKSNFFEELGAVFYIFSKSFKRKKIKFYADSIKSQKVSNYIDNILKFVHGFNLKSYIFNKYKTQIKNEYNFSFEICSKEKNTLSKNYFKYKAIESGIFLTRDLVSEPPNVLYPKKYKDEIKNLVSSD